MTQSSTPARMLPDTSVWVEYLRLGDRGRARHLGHLLGERRILTCGPVVAEVLAGTRPEDQESLGRLLGGLAWAELDHTAWRRIGQVAGELRRAGQSVALTDITIAVAAELVDAAVWTADQDFARVRQFVESLRLYPLE